MVLTAISHRNAGAGAAAADQERLETGSDQETPQEDTGTAASQRSDHTDTDADLDDAADAAAAQAAQSRHSDDDKSAAGHSAGILGLSDDLDARSLVSHCSLMVSCKIRCHHALTPSFQMQTTVPCSVQAGSGHASGLASRHA
jgi:hypothetical protein